MVRDVKPIRYLIYPDRILNKNRIRKNPRARDVN
jgi:hypothetical protein